MIIHSNQSILIPVDFSKQSLVAVGQAYNLARFTKSKIILMHVSTTNIDENKSELQELAETTRKTSGLEIINPKVSLTFFKLFVFVIFII